MNLSSLHWKADSFLFEEDNFIYFFYLWLHWDSSCGEQGLLSSCGTRVSHCSGLSLRSVGSRACGLSHYSSWALVHRLNHCCTRMGLVASLHVGSGMQILNHCIAREFSIATYSYCSLHSSFGSSPPPLSRPSQSVSLEAVTSLGLSQEVCGDVTRCISTLSHLSLPSPSLLFPVSTDCRKSHIWESGGPCLNPRCLGSGSAGLSPDL